MSDVAETLKDRDSKYGSYKIQASITQGLLGFMMCCPNWDLLSDSQKESLHMIAAKIGRILNGDPNYADSWHDIAGYAKLIENQIVEKETER